MHSTYPYDVVIGQLEHARSQDDVDQLLRDYRIYTRGSLESAYSASEAAELVDEHVAKNVGWLLGEISEDARRRVLQWLPENVSHPVLGRTVERLNDHELVLRGAEWAISGQS